MIKHVYEHRRKYDELSAQVTTVTLITSPLVLYPVIMLTFIWRKKISPTADFIVILDWKLDPHNSVLI